MGLLSRAIGELDRPAILVGNGINRLDNTFPNWEDLLLDLGGINLDFTGMTYNEIYNIIELRRGDDRNLKGQVVQQLQNPGKNDLFNHKAFIDLVRINKCPVLTTNFDHGLEDSSGLQFYRTTKKGFTRYYPWDTYASYRPIESPIDGFAVWHIHGMIKYADSIRLGLTDYMGCVERARKWIHNSPESLFGGKDRIDWPGRNSWLHIWFNKPLVIVGLALESQEVFIRWLLIERERYFSKFPNRRERTVFISNGDNSQIKNFLKNLNIDYLITDHYRDLYR